MSKIGTFLDNREYIFKKDKEIKKSLEYNFNSFALKNHGFSNILLIILAVFVFNIIINTTNDFTEGYRMIHGEDVSMSKISFSMLPDFYEINYFKIMMIHFSIIAMMLVNIVSAYNDFKIRNKVEKIVPYLNIDFNFSLMSNAFFSIVNLLFVIYNFNDWSPGASLFYILLSFSFIFIITFSVILNFPIADFSKNEKSSTKLINSGIDDYLKNKKNLEKNNNIYNKILSKKEYVIELIAYCKENTLSKSKLNIVEDMFETLKSKKEDENLKNQKISSFEKIAKTQFDLNETDLKVLNNKELEKYSDIEIENY